jgi:hypothetical protein
LEYGLLRFAPDTSGLKADEEILIGGKPGSDRFTSLKDAANLV